MTENIDYFNKNQVRINKIINMTISGGLNIFQNKNSKDNEEIAPGANTEEANKELEECRKKAEEYLNGWKRAQADFVNFKKRQEESLKEWIVFSKAGLITELLPILDSFDNALKNKPVAPDEESKKWIEGVAKIAAQLSKILKEAGLEEIISKGAKLDTQIHEAIDAVPSEMEEGTVLEEVQKGYKISGKVIRTAKVRVAIKKDKKIH